MELGWTIYFFVVFGLGGLLLLGLTAYFAWELVYRHQHPAWASRSRAARVLTVLAALLFAWLLFIPIRMVWITRVDAIVGSYTSTGVWGNATLTLQPDGTFVETWRFQNAYNGAPEGQGVIQGMWRDLGRDWLTRNIDLHGFKRLAEYDREHLSGASDATVTGYGGVTSIEVDAGSDIVFRK